MDILQMVNAMPSEKRESFYRILRPLEYKSSAEVMHDFRNPEKPFKKLKTVCGLYIDPYSDAITRAKLFVDIYLLYGNLSKYLRCNACDLAIELHEKYSFREIIDGNLPTNPVLAGTLVKLVKLYKNDCNYFSLSKFTRHVKL